MDRFVPPSVMHIVKENKLNRPPLNEYKNGVKAHGWERIEMNDGFRLGDLSEEGLEALNKWIRRLRIGGARTSSTLFNFTDTFNHLWERSRPTIVEMERQIKKKKSKVNIATEIETLVLSLFVEDE